jgi:hypothetical protein
MGETRKTRVVSTTANLKARKAEDNCILLARGWSARQTGANIPLSCLAPDEIERDLRHMEAFSNACTMYAQQYYIYHNNQTVSKDNPADNSQDGKKQQQQQQQQQQLPPTPAPLIAMPVRIDPEEEKRLANLRQKIQQCEAQREVYEGQYLSLRAHYIYLSQQLKMKRDDVNQRCQFLQSQVNKRGRLVALQRVRLQILRETLQCLQYREKCPVVSSSGDVTELYSVWNDIESKWKKAEDDLTATTTTTSSSSKSSCGSTSTSSSSTNNNGNILHWSASHIPKIPPGVPLLLSQLAEQPGQAAAWGTSGAFGAKPHSLLWIDNQVPTSSPDTAEELPALREEQAKLKEEIASERALNKEFQMDVITRRQKNDELVAMMALLRTETEAAISRHNIIMESDLAKLAALKLLEAEERQADQANGAAAGGGAREKKGSAASATAATGNALLPESSGLKEDDENDGDDEGGAEEEEDEGEILEDGSGKRPVAGDSESSRSKRRKL